MMRKDQGETLFDKFREKYTMSDNERKTIDNVINYQLELNSQKIKNSIVNTINKKKNSPTKNSPKKSEIK